MHASNASLSGVALYAQLASRLRQEIITGALPVNTRLPTVADMAAQYNVAIVTVRQALKALADEGLVAGARGRGTFVIGLPPGPSDDLRAAINDAVVPPEHLLIRLLETRRDVQPPRELCRDGAVFPSYTLIRKVHLHQGAPFCTVELYVATEILDRLPNGAERFHKVNALIDQHLPGNLCRASTSITVTTADYDLANLLEYAFGAPIARVRRSVYDTNGQLVYGGIFRYRGDRFILDVETGQDARRSREPKARKPAFKRKSV